MEILEKRVELILKAKNFFAFIRNIILLSIQICSLSSMSSLFLLFLNFYFAPIYDFFFFQILLVFV